MRSPAPRLVVTDALGRRIVNIDKPLFTIGRRSETDLRLPGRRYLACPRGDQRSKTAVYVIRDKQSRFGTFVNGEKHSEKVLAHGDQIRLGQAGDTEIVFFVDDEAPSVERSAMSAASELRQMAALLESLRALGIGPGARRGAGDGARLGDRGHRRRARIHHAGQPRAAARVQAGPRARQGHAVRAARSRRAARFPRAVFSTGQQTIVEDLLDGDLAQLHTGTVALGIRHVLCTPLRLVRYVERAEQKGADEIIGVLYLDSRERGALRSAHAQSALDTLSAEAALAIENARLYREALDKAKFEQELQVAAAIQQSLLPVANREGAVLLDGGRVDRLPRGRRRLLRLRRSADRPVRLHHRRRGGKGSPAALLAAAVLGMFSAEATYQTGAAPLMTRLNHGLFRRAIEARFLTSFYGMLSPDGSLTYCNAGHNAPLLVTKSGIRRLETGGVVLGLFDTASYEEETLKLEPGDLIVLFSDGVTEAMNAEDEEFTDDRLIACANAHRGKAPQQVLDALLADVHAFCAGEAQSDDVTAVLVRYNGT